MNSNKNELMTEWCLLQNQFDSYEKHSLYIKLVSILVLLSAEISGFMGISLIFILFVLWGQDAIWKTFQSRIEPRLFQIEKSISTDCSESACQFNSEYNKVSLSSLALIMEYARQSVRPTIAFPHVALIIIMLTQYLLNILQIS
ncbi:MAG: hypothetical protein QMC62_10630 [Alteromonadaceae bacterium]|jgi:hypothetical protein